LDGIYDDDGGGGGDVCDDVCDDGELSFWVLMVSQCMVF
jgi:hypothetical protein